jgi:hypothetical protein
LNLSTQWWLGNVQFFGGIGKALFIGNRNKVTKMAKFHKFNKWIGAIICKMTK